MLWKPEKIRELRQRLGWTQAEMGRRLACKHEQVMNLELGLRTPDLEQLRTLDYLSGLVDFNSHIISQRPLADRVVDDFKLSQIQNFQIQEFIDSKAKR